jgi:uncharacterized protein YdeI (YjbR/CyaY-like superfamily)
MALAPDLPLVPVASRDEWRRWLEANHLVSRGVWVVTSKKSALAPGARWVSPRDVNEECLCFGWVDSRPGSVDEARSALLCTPRTPGSGWSRVNKERLEALLAAGRVHRSGLDAIERAKADGSWSRLDEVDALIVPADLAAALDRLSPARDHFDRFPPSTRKAILEWIAQAKTDGTRSRRVEETATLAQRNVRANQWPRRGRGDAR